MTPPKRDIARLLGPEPFPIPVAREQRFTLEQTPNCRILHALTLVLTVHHDVQQRFEGRTCGFHAAVIEVVHGDAALRFDNAIHARREGLRVLLLRPQ